MGRNRGSSAALVLPALDGGTMILVLVAVITFLHKPLETKCPFAP